MKPNITTNRPLTLKLNSTSPSNSRTINDDTAALDCKETNDLVIVLDASGSLGVAKYHRVKDFVAKLAVAFGNHLESRQGFIFYSASVSILFDLKDNLSSSEMETAIREHSYKAGPTYTHLGIKTGMQMLLKDKETRLVNKVREF